MRIASADRASVRLYRTAVQSAALEDLLIRMVHIHVALIQTLLVDIKGIRILHDELSGTQQSKTRTRFISVLGLNLI